VSKRVVLAYSGGLDTSVAIRWIAEKYDMEVIALTVDVGAERDLDAIKAKATQVGAVKALVLDARDEFVRYFVWPALQADALYEGKYPLATALARPLIAKLMVDVARDEGAQAVAHGCTGKGNDQVRFDVSVQALAPDLKIIAPVREWTMTRPEEIAYAERHGIPIPVTVSSPYSIDQNLWGRSIETGVLEDPNVEPPADVYQWTKAPEEAPDRPRYLEVRFEQGLPVAVDGEEMPATDLVMHLNQVGGEHGVGRIDHVENRLVGIKSREIYEAPAAVLLLEAHQALQALTLGKDQLDFKAGVAREYARLIYNGLWFSRHQFDLSAYVQSTQRMVTGTVRLKLYKGGASVVGRTSPFSLYDPALATYAEGDTFDQSNAVGFINIFGQGVRTQAQVQLLRGPDNGPDLLPPRVTPRE
jgi:argininosuccinate synthase